ncbi:MAG: DNA mismatch repair protein MutS [Lachnospiraceae bacterium]|nr:DNA mismatch repair protein MutS [Lachnospiraceae bacterium]
MMVKYLETKEEYSDCILFYRLGDFYEMFYDDAVLTSRELELTLTGKSCGLEERAPMCGVPFHAVDTYLNRLVQKGYKVAICEQTEDPKLAKGLVKREVTRIVTPGTNTDLNAMDETKNNFIMCIYYGLRRIGISVADVTTGDYYLSEAESNKELFDEICRYMPTEIVANEFFFSCGLDIVDLKNRLGIAMFTLPDYEFEENLTKKTLLRHFKVNSLIGMGIDEYETGCVAAGALLKYLQDTQMIPLTHLTHLYPNSAGKYMVLDAATRRNLELTETLREKQKRGSLFWVLDKTKTAMGARMLRSFIEQPYIRREDIEHRLNAVENLTTHSVSRDEIREYLSSVYDLERLLGKVSYQSINPRDMIAFRNSLEMLPPIRSVLSDCEDPCLKEILSNIDPLDDIAGRIRETIVEEPPFSIREGGMIKEGSSSDADYLRKAKTDGKTWLAQLEEKERERTGIKNLRIRYNKVFGYYLEVTNSFKDQVPEDYIRKQTLVNAERFTTPRLKELEDTILNAEEKLNDLEYDIFVELRNDIASALDRIQKTAKAVALLDAICSLSYVGEQNGYVKPVFNDKNVINIKEGRHPVVEKMLQDTLFIPNDTLLDQKSNQIAIITGPNMAGKSTYMRQTALIVLMAQIGSYVPAKNANIGVVDRIFTRVGASDDLSSGQSTFMVEMNEVSNILRNATKNSLLILDEIGRGTSTFDGLAIAWAVIEHIANRNLLGSKTLFATHYHLLTELEEKMDNVKNYCIAVKERGDDIVFLRKIIPGGTDRSYGIEVAKLAGVPDIVIERAKVILSELSEGDIASMVADINVSSSDSGRPHKAIKRQDEVDAGQLSFFDSVSDAEIIEEIRGIDISTLTPLDGLNLLYRIQNRIKNRI